MSAGRVAWKERRGEEKEGEITGAARRAVAAVRGRRREGRNMTAVVWDERGVMVSLGGD
jgi:hypothetical protein